MLQIKDNLNEETLEKVPSIIMYIYIACLNKTPIGGRTIDTALEEYPQYFYDDGICPEPIDFDKLPKGEGILEQIKKRNVYTCPCTITELINKS